MSDKKFPIEAKVGIFVAVAIAGLIFLTTQINRSGFSFKGRKTITMLFPDVSGLLPRTGVEYSGIRVGLVDRIYLDGNRVYVVTKIDRDVKLYQDSQIVLKSRGILGEKIIAIGGGGKMPEIPDGGSVEAQSSAGDFDTAMQNFNDVAQAVKDLLKGGEGKPSIQDIIENVTLVSEDLRTLVQSNRKDLDEIVKNVHTFTKMLNDGELKATISNLKSTSDMIKSFVESADPQLRDVVKDFNGLSNKIDNTISGLDRIVAKIDRGEGTIGKLINDDTTVEKVNDTLDGINDFVSRVRKLEVAVGFRGDYLGTSSQLQSTASFRIQPNFDKYFLFEFTSGPLELNSAKTTITDSGEGNVGAGDPPLTTRRIEEERKTQFSFTALFARRFYDLTLKAGLMQSTGGFGLEYHLFRDHLSLGADFFDFSRETNPHLRLYSALTLWKILKIRGGVDDMIVEGGRRNYFAGIGVMLTDSDLKSLIGLAPLVSSR